MQIPQEYFNLGMILVAIMVYLGIKGDSGTKYRRDSRRDVTNNGENRNRGRREGLNPFNDRNSFNRNDENREDVFVKDESKHSKRHRTIERLKQERKENIKKGIEQLREQRKGEE